MRSLFNRTTGNYYIRGVYNTSCQYIENNAQNEMLMSGYNGAETVVFRMDSLGQEKEQFALYRNPRGTGNMFAKVFQLPDSAYLVYCATGGANPSRGYLGKYHQRTRQKIWGHEEEMEYSNFVNVQTDGSVLFIKGRYTFTGSSNIDSSFLVMVNRDSTIRWKVLISRVTRPQAIGYTALDYDGKGNAYIAGSIRPPRVGNFFPFNDYYIVKVANVGYPFDPGHPVFQPYVGNNPTEGHIFVKCYPNPSKGSVTIVLPEVLQSYKVRVIDLVGRVHSEEEYNAGTQRMEIPQNAGLYLVQVLALDGRVLSTQKVLRE